MADKDSVIRIKPLYYIHVLDNNSNVTRVEVGPQTFTRQDHEKVLGPPESMIMIPPRHYAIISNPVVRISKENKPERDRHGNVKLKHGDEEIRFEQDPFPLYPGEKLVGKVSPLQVVAPDSALRLRALRDFTTEEGKRLAGDEWLFRGPGTYSPRIEVQVVEIIRATIVKENQALKLKARQNTVDFSGKPRQAGEEYLHRIPGAYIPGVDEEIIETVKAIVLTEKKALHLRASRTFKDVFTQTRRAGDEWLITIRDAETHIPDVYEVVVGEVPLTTLTNRQFCVIVDPIGDHGKNLFGRRILRKGEISFFLRPGERLESGIQNVYILGSEESLLLRARETYEGVSEGKKVIRAPGERWMIYGPTDYVPPVEVEVVERRKSIALDENEGVYVRDIKTGKVRSHIGRSYMLAPNEELWEKTLSAEVETELAKARAGGDESKAPPRDKTRVVSYRAPHNSAVQIYDYLKKKSRVVFGPELIMLGSDEQFTVNNLSGGKPKTANKIKAIAILLGPDFMTDVVLVETSDHARLSLQLAYNWNFEIDRTKEDDPQRIFQVPDFVGDACKTIASRVRGAVARVSFDEFHKNSAEVIRTAVFGVATETGQVRNRFQFNANSLIITNIDIQSVEPVDQRTRDSLQKSVQLAIEITTKSQEAAARHEAERLEQEAKGKLERQKINDESAAEGARKRLLELQAESAAVEATGQATAEARAKANAAAIEGEAAISQATLSSQAGKIKTDAELTQKINQQNAEIEHLRSVSTLEVAKAKELAIIETKKFADTVAAIGPETIKSIAKAGPEMQAKLLQSLNLQGVMFTDGNNPVNLFNTASGLVGGPRQ